MSRSQNSALRCSTVSPTVTWSCRHFCLCEVSALAGSWEPGTASYLPALLSPRDLGAQALWAWQVDGGQDELCSVPKGTLHSPQVKSPPYPGILSSWLSAASLPLGIISAELSGSDFPCYTFVRPQKMSARKLGTRPSCWRAGSSVFLCVWSGPAN